MRWLSRATTVAAALALAGLAVLVVWPAVRPPHVVGHFRTHADFRNAADLPVGSRVVIAGVVVGEIDSLTIEGSQARVGMRLRDDVVLWDDAFATRKASSALSDNYIELSPGGPDPSDPDSMARPHRRLRSGEAIPRVIEAATTDRVLRGLERAVPRAEDAMAAAQVLVEEGREWTAGELQRRLAALDHQLDERVVDRRLDGLVEASLRVDRATASAQAKLATALPAIDRGLDRFAKVSTDATTRLRGATADVHDGLAGVRDRLDDVDGYVARAGELVDSVAGEHAGTLGKLIHDDELGNQLTDATASLADAAGSLDRLKTAIGFRTEFNLAALAPRFYVTAQIASRGDQFYLVELMKGFDGDRPQVDLIERPGGWVRVARIREGIRYTAQWGKRFGRFALRFGFADSAIGAGADASFFGGHLRLSADVSQSAYGRLPKVKLAAALEVFRSVYVLGGIDDALTGGAELNIAPWPPDADVPIALSELHYGRDYFLGFNLAFNDADINRLLRIYGALVAALVR
ncbi:MAG TPA: MlaD family protein [Kofleriaceae bacterium]|nr:MlaD family protein [Kofleriaceae bacterium]